MLKDTQMMPKVSNNKHMFVPFKAIMLKIIYH